MRWTSDKRRASSRSRRYFRALVSSLWICLFLGLALTPGRVDAADGPKVLTAPELDAVTSAGLRMDLELTANATGQTAMTSTQGSVTIGRTTVLRVEIDPSAPAPAQARLIGAFDADFGIAVGKADARGASDAQCSANVATSGADYSTIVQSKDFTAMSATCACTAVAIGILAK